MNDGDTPAFTGGANVKHVCLRGGSLDIVTVAQSFVYCYVSVSIELFTLLLRRPRQHSRAVVLCWLSVTRDLKLLECFCYYCCWQETVSRTNSISLPHTPLFDDLRITCEILVHMYLYC